MATHRYWRLNVTLNGAGSGVISLTDVMGAETAHGPNLLAAATLTVTSTGGGSTTTLQDGNPTTNWWSSGAFPQALKYDFGATSGNWKDVQEIRLYVDPAWFPQGPKDFVWAYSDDDITYTPYITVTGYAWAAVSNTTALGRVFRTGTCPDTLPGYFYWQVYITDVNTPANGPALQEVEFRDTIGGTDRSSLRGTLWSHLGSGNPAPQAFDNGSAGWFGEVAFSTSGVEWIGCELDQRRNIAQCALTSFASFGNSAPKSGFIRGSNDRTTWTNVLSFTNQTAWGSAETRTFSTLVTPLRRRPIILPC